MVEHQIRHIYHPTETDWVNPSNQNSQMEPLTSKEGPRSRSLQRDLELVAPSFYIMLYFNIIG